MQVCLFFINLKKITFRLRDIGDHCLNDKQCPKTSICKAKTCQCPSFSIQRGHRCVKKVEEPYNLTKKSKRPATVATFLNLVLHNKHKKITNNNLLNRKNGFTKKERNIKSCLFNEVWFNGKCLHRKLLLGATCAASAQCVKNAQCVNSRCKCKIGYAGNNNKCFGIN